LPDDGPAPRLRRLLTADLNRVTLGVAGFDQLATEGKAKLDGDREIIHKLRDLMVTFTPDFEILPGTAPTQRQVPPGRPFALPDPIPAALGGELVPSGSVATRAPGYSFEAGRVAQGLTTMSHGDLRCL